MTENLKNYKKNGYRVVVLSASKTRAEHLAKDLQEEEVSCYYAKDFERELQPGEILTAYGKVKRGYEYPLIKFAVITESDIFGQEKKKRKKHRLYEGEKIQSEMLVFSGFDQEALDEFELRVGSLKRA